MALCPTQAPPGRLARLGLVADPAHDLTQTGRVGDLAGVHAVWVDGDASPLRVLAEVVHRARVGVMLPAERIRPGIPELAYVAARFEGRLEVTLQPTGDVAAAVDTLRTRFAGPVGVEVRTAAEVADLASRVDDFVVRAEPDGDVAERAATVRDALVAAGRGPGGIAVVVAVSIGRTRAESRARAEAGGFAGVARPETNGVYGTLEECQRRVVELVHAGATDLRCVLPATRDLGDVVAQLTAVTIGTADVLRPGAPRSKAPDPPIGWGGRPRFR